MHEHCYIYTILHMYPRSIRRCVWDRMRLHLPVPVDGGDIPILFRCDVEQKNMFAYASPLGTGCRFLRSLTFIGGGILT